MYPRQAASGLCNSSRTAVFGTHDLHREKTSLRTNACGFNAVRVFRIALGLPIVAAFSVHIGLLSFSLQRFADSCAGSRMS
jgi:hypothetical protein